MEWRSPLNGTIRILRNFTKKSMRTFKFSDNFNGKLAIFQKKLRKFRNLSSIFGQKFRNMHLYAVQHVHEAINLLKELCREINGNLHLFENP